MDFERNPILVIPMATLFIVLSPILLVLDGVRGVIKEFESEQGRRMWLKEKVIFYALGAYAVTTTCSGVALFIYGFFRLISFVGEIIS